MISQSYSYRIAIRRDRMEANQLSMEEPDPEAEDLRAVGLGLDDGEAEVQGDRHGPKHRHGETQAGTNGDAVVLEFGSAFDGAGVSKEDEPDLVVGAKRNLILGTVEEHEIAAHHETAVIGANTAVLEAADGLETA